MAIAYVKSASGFSNTTYNVSIAPTAGNFLIVAIWLVEGGGIPTCTDNLSHTYIMDANVTYDNGFGLRRLVVLHYQNIASGITYITVGPSVNSRTAVIEYSGMPTTGTVFNAIGTPKINTPATTSWSSNATSITGQSLVLALQDTGATANASYAATGSWAFRLHAGDTGDGDDSCIADQLNVPTGSYTATGTSTSVVTASVIIAYLNGISGGVNVPVILNQYRQRTL